MFVVHPHKVIVTLDAAEPMTSGGIVLPESAQDQVQTGTVVIGGDDQPFEKGSQVMVPKGSGVPFQYESVQYVVIHKDSVLAGIV